VRRRPGRDLQAAATRLCQRALPVRENVFGTALLVVSLVLVGANRLLTVRAGCRGWTWRRTTAASTSCSWSMPPSRAQMRR